MKTKVINFVAGPSSGKSTMAALLFAELKTMHLRAEYVQEVAKFLIYQEKFEELNNQYNVSMSQYNLLKSIDGQVQFICIDSPLILGLYYNKNYESNICNVEKVEKIILDKMSEFDNIYIFLERNDFPYETSGRVHSFDESVKIDQDLKLLLGELNIPYKTFLSDRASVQGILEYILEE